MDKATIVDLARLPPEESEAWVNSLSLEELDELEHDWPFYAREEQLPPPGEWVFWAVICGRGWGKALALDTPIRTPSGWSTMGDISDGDLVYDEEGRPTRVTKAHPVLFGRKCYRVAFSDGSTIVADGDHLWSPETKLGRKASARGNPRPNPVLSTEEIRATLYYGVERNYSIRCAGPLYGISDGLRIDPYLLGCWLGDGSSSGAEITTADVEIVAAFESSGFRMTRYAESGRSAVYGITDADGKRSRDTQGRFSSDGASFREMLREIGVLGEKHIPHQYLFASSSDRTALIQGLLDTDGTCDEESGRIEFTSTNETLAHGFLDLSLGLGFKARMSVGDATIDGRVVSKKYRIQFTAHDDRPMFRLRRKLQRQRTRGSQADRCYRRYIVSVDPVPSVPVRCITVASRSSLYLAGRSLIATHNTRTGAEWIRFRVRQGFKYPSLCGPTAADVRMTLIEGESGLLSVCWNNDIDFAGNPMGEPKYEPSKRQVTWANGALLKLFSGEEPERFRGPQHDTLWFDELAAYTRARDTWRMAQYGMRLGPDPKTLVTTTPKPIPILLEILKSPKTHRTSGSSYDNRSNLSDVYYETVIAPQEGTSEGRQEIHAEVLEEAEGALWKREMLESLRVEGKPLQELKKIVVAIDPAAKSKKENDETGIVTVGRGYDDHGYVLADASGHHTPGNWGRRAIDAFHMFDADLIVAESNNGGEMVRHTIHTLDPDVPVKLVHASRGKLPRAQPIASVFEQGKGHMVGCFDQLEAQLVTWDPLSGDDSPDRLDAMVWGFTELFPYRYSDPVLAAPPIIVD